MFRYLAALRPGKIVLWCYLIWYFVTLFFYFDPKPSIWINSLGISVVIGIALMLSINHRADERADRWQTFRLFLMPFCVSSFSSLIKGRDYILILPPQTDERLALISACGVFLIAVVAVKFVCKRRI